MAPQSFEDNETTFEELQTRLANAIDYSKTFSPEQIDGSEMRNVVLKTRHGEQIFEGHAYLLHFAIPNLFSHCTTAYNILRVAGRAIFWGRRKRLASFCASKEIGCKSLHRQVPPKKCETVRYP